MKDKIRQRVHGWISEEGIEPYYGIGMGELDKIINRSIMETAKVLLEEHGE